MAIPPQMLEIPVIPPPELQDAVTEALRTAQPQARPFLVHTLGGPGSGKTRFIETLAQTLPEPKPLFIAFDRLMESMPDYRADPDRQHAFAQHELMARQAGYHLLNQAMQKRSHIVFEHSGANASHLDILLHARQVHGYHIVIVDLQASAATAHRRLEDRQAREGRFTPPHYVEERAAILAPLIPLYQATADHWLTLDNDRDGDELMQTAKSLAGYLKRL